MKNKLIFHEPSLSFNTDIPYNYRFLQHYSSSNTNEDDKELKDETFFEVNMPLLQSSKVPVLAYTKPISKLFSEPQ
jgi:hypothetical protein